MLGGILKITMVPPIMDYPPMIIFYGVRTHYIHMSPLTMDQNITSIIVDFPVMLETLAKIMAQSSISVPHSMMYHSVIKYGYETITP